MKNSILVISLLLLLSFNSKSQEIVTFYSEDSLLVTASSYELNPDFSYVVLFHQASSSRGEFNEIALRILKLGYNCLAVDLRSGEESNFVKNETAKLAEAGNFKQTYFDAKKDMDAAIDYAYTKSGNKKVVLLGSSYSASLSLIIANENARVRAVLAYSPVESFKPKFKVVDKIKGLDKPTYIACSQREFPFLQDMNDAITSTNKILFKPQNGSGEHGAKSLWSKYPVSREYWMSLMVFFNNIKE